MLPLLNSQEMKKMDRYTIQDLNIPEMVLMEHAALAVQEALKSRFGSIFKSTKGLILAGSGNNGADALATARLLHLEGFENFFVINLEAEGKQDRKSRDRQLSILGKLKVPFAKKLDSKLIEACDWVVDGIFGTGLTRPLSETHAKLIQQINEHAKNKWIVSIDIPSGLSADLGSPLPVAINASHTVTLGFLKKGLVTGSGADYVGKLTISPIQIPRQIPFPVHAFFYTSEDAKKLPKRVPSSHKGNYGHVYIFAGEEAKEGAALLSCLGALKSGAGLVSLVGEEKQLKAARARLPIEVMTETFTKDFFKVASKGVIVIGPGLGVTEEAWKKLEACLKSTNPLILDADALTLLSQNKKAAIPLLKKRKGLTTVLTPHPKEAAVLLSKDLAFITKDRFLSIEELTKEFHTAVILKGKGSLVQRPDEPILCVGTGDTGLSKGGSGDLLSGVLGSLIAQKIPEVFALPLGVYVHGRASELLTQRFGHERSHTASEISEELSHALKELEEGA